MPTITPALHGTPCSGRRGDEGDLAVGQVAGVVVVHVRLIARRDLAKTLAIHADLEHLPLVERTGHGEQDLVGVPVQVDVGDQASALGMVDRRDPPVGPDGRENGDLVIPRERLVDPGVGLRALPRQANVLAQAIACPVLPPRVPVRHPLDHQQLLEVQERVGQQSLSLERVEVGHELG